MVHSSGISRGAGVRLPPGLFPVAALVTRSQLPAVLEPVLPTDLKAGGSAVCTPTLTLLLGHVNPHQAVPAPGPLPLFNAGPSGNAPGFTQSAKNTQARRPPCLVRVLEALLCLSETVKRDGDREGGVTYFSLSAPLHLQNTTFLFLLAEHENKMFSKRPGFG